jgi:hypothetical protein
MNYLDLEHGSREHTIFFEGYEAYDQGRECPYKPGTEEYELWTSGYTLSMQDSEDIAKYFDRLGQR